MAKRLDEPVRSDGCAPMPNDRWRRNFSSSFSFEGRGLSGH
jgi:hypothetical protein